MSREQILHLFSDVGRGVWCHLCATSSTSFHADSFPMHTRISTRISKSCSVQSHGVSSTREQVRAGCKIGCARVFQNSVGSSASLALSEETDYSDAFLSHTWSTPRWKKFMALCLYCNARVALVAALFAGVLLSAGIACMIPPLTKVSNPLISYARFFPYATMVVPMVFQVMLHRRRLWW